MGLHSAIHMVILDLLCFVLFRFVPHILINRFFVTSRTNTFHLLSAKQSSETPRASGGEAVHDYFLAVHDYFSGECCGWVMLSDDNNHNAERQFSGGCWRLEGTVSNE